MVSNQEGYLFLIMVLEVMEMDMVMAMVMDTVTVMDMHTAKLIAVTMYRTQLSPGLKIYGV